MLGLGLSLQKGISAFNAGRALVSSYIRRVTDAGGVLQNTACDAAAINELNQDRLLETASWVLVPDGIEEDVVFAQKPTSGLGDLNFQRASDATYTDASGVVRRSPYNLLQQSNTFNVTWGAAFATVTIGQSGYDGTNNAWLFSKSLADGRISQNITLTSGAYTYSVYAKAGTKNWIFLRVDGTSNRTAYFNLQTGVTGTASGCTSSISSVGNGWYRCSITFTDSMTIARVYVADANNDTSGTSGNILIQAAQLVEGTSALDYFPTTNRQDVPRIDFRNADGTLSSCGRLLLEPQRTNSIRNSSMVGAVAGTPGTLPTNWGVVNSGLTQNVVGTGTENGLPYIDLRFNGTASGNECRVQFETTTQIAATVGQTWTSSVYVKRISGTIPSGAGISLLRNIEYNSSGGFVSLDSLNITIGNNLSRFAFSRAIIGSTTAFIRNEIYLGLINGQTYDFTIRIAAPQMELGNFASTWVPTTTAAVTRLADVASKTGVSSLIGQTEGTLYCEFNIGADTFDGDLISVNGGSSANGFFVSFRSSKVVQLIVRTSSTNALVFQRIGNYPIGTNKIAVAYKNGDFAISLNGTAAQFNTTTITMPTGISVVELSVPRLYTSPMPIAQAQAALFPTRLSNSELQSLTTL